MQKVTPRIVLAGWGLWVFWRLFLLFTASVWRSGGSPVAWGMTIGGFVVPAIGGWLAWQLYARPRRSVAVWFAVFCILLLWKFYVGEIVFRMHPAMGGLTFSGAAAAWWSSVTASVISAITTVLSLVLLLFSLVYWPRYCL